MYGDHPTFDPLKSFGTIEAPVELKRNCDDWFDAWRALGDALLAKGIGTGADLEQECEGHVWQYLFSEIDTVQWLNIHEFRHRCHPVTRRREYVHVFTKIL